MDLKIKKRKSNMRKQMHLNMTQRNIIYLLATNKRNLFTISNLSKDLDIVSDLIRKEVDYLKDLDLVDIVLKKTSNETSNKVPTHIKLANNKKTLKEIEKTNVIHSVLHQKWVN